MFRTVWKIQQKSSTPNEAWMQGLIKFILTCSLVTKICAHAAEGWSGLWYLICCMFLLQWPYLTANTTFYVADFFSFFHFLSTLLGGFSAIAGVRCNPRSPLCTSYSAFRSTWALPWWFLPLNFGAWRELREFWQLSVAVSCSFPSVFHLKTYPFLWGIQTNQALQYLPSLPLLVNAEVSLI